MNESYERDQERLINTAGQVIQTAVSVGTQLWMARHKPIEVQMKTAADDLQDSRQQMKQGKSSQEILNSLQQGETYGRIARSGGDAKKYSQLMMRQAEIENAMEKNPDRSLTQQKTPKKAL